MEQWNEVDPVPGHTAFQRSDPAALHSQAAFLLVLGRQAGSRRSNLDSHAPAYATDAEESVDLEPDARALVIPDWVREPLDVDLVLARTDAANTWPSRIVRANERRLAEALYDKPSGDAALDLIIRCLDARFPLVRVAAAAANLHLDLAAQDHLVASGVPTSTSAYTRDPLVRLEAVGADDTRRDADDLVQRPSSLPRRAIEVLMRGAGDQNELVRDVAVAALEAARFHFERRDAPDPTTDESGDGDPSAGRPPKTSVLVHGTTFGRTAGWWQPGRVFPKYLKANVCRNLYSGSRPFAWPGLYSHRARELGAQDLAGWREGHRLDHVFAYSHGGSVAMLASGLGRQMEKLVLLSCPVHKRYVPDFRRVHNVVSVRTRLDLVILADGGGQRFRDHRIEEHVLPIWFSHRATRQPAVWQRHNINAML